MNAAYTAPIELPMTIYHAAELKEFMLDVLERGPCVHFDLSAVPEIDCAGVQLLVAARRRAAERQQACEFVGANDAVLATLALLGVAQTLTQAQPSVDTLSALQEPAL
ncbi:STAS domain-containing protein [Paraburkholderia kururiensis]|uniref:STAS domain-containing protein n=1 Tax=Paraburkholderia kururiensis TaxID=984307 RepID=A0ABZ0WLK6_9BURK|nr:STAS domain-containing protein [Paraburkholderia kururiensis]WQD78233.1 STAS domain-containing protein [Paraburkholderia kururiensis]